MPMSKCLFLFDSSRGSVFLFFRKPEAQLFLNLLSQLLGVRKGEAAYRILSHRILSYLKIK